MSQENKGGMKRRDFLKVLGVVGGTAAVTTSCSEPVEQIIPYVVPPENVVPGIPQFYTTTCRECSAGCGIIVKNRDGRAIKVEGNPDSPNSKGKTCALGQASLQGLYNPDRVRSPLRWNEETNRHEPIGWEQGETILADKINEIVSAGNSRKIAYISNEISGSYSNLLNEFLTKLGGARHYTYETFTHEPLKKANEIAFGNNTIPKYKLSEAKYLLSFGADYLETWLSTTENALGFSKIRDVDHGKTGKIVHVEPRNSMTAANADKWVDIKPGTEQYLALGIANVILKKGWNKLSAGPASSLISSYTPSKVSKLTEVSEELINEIAKDFSKNKSLAIGGGAATTASNATETLVAVNILNYITGNIGKTIDFSDTLSISNANSYKEIVKLVEDMKAGRIELLFVHNVNPLFTLPKQLEVEKALEKVPFIVSLSSFLDETSEKSNLVLPESTNFESWGDYRSSSKYINIIQPAMRPVFNTKGAGDLIISVSKKVDSTNNLFDTSSFYDYLRKSWKELASSQGYGTDFETFWKKILVEGGVEINKPSVTVSLSSAVSNVNFRDPEFKGDGGYYFVAYPSYRLYDGRGANKPWLQELPDAITTAVWDSWIEIHPENASKMGLKDGSFVKVDSPQGSFEAQVFVYEGIRKDTIAMPLGQGHTSYGRYAKGRGVNPIEYLPSFTDKLSGGLAWLSTKVNVSSLGKGEMLVRTQYTKSQEDRKVAQTVSLDDLKHGKHDDHHGEHGEHPDFYPEREYKNYRWGMAIDLNKCTGCGSCVTACYAENNIAFVGKAQVAKRREMSWIRIQRFFDHRVVVYTIHHHDI